jgi:hypothetical protein
MVPPPIASNMKMCKGEDPQTAVRKEVLPMVGRWDGTACNVSIGTERRTQASKADKHSPNTHTCVLCLTTTHVPGTPHKVLHHGVPHHPFAPLPALHKIQQANSPSML